MTQNQCSPFVADAHREREIIHLHQKELSCRHTDTNQHSSEHMPQRLLRRFEAISCSEMSGVFHHVQQTSRMEDDKDFENPGAGELSTMSSTGSLEQQFLLSRAFWIATETKKGFIKHKHISLACQIIASHRPFFFSCFQPKAPR